MKYWWLMFTCTLCWHHLCCILAPAPAAPRHRDQLSVSASLNTALMMAAEVEEFHCLGSQSTWHDSEYSPNNHMRRKYFSINGEMIFNLVEWNIFQWWNIFLLWKIVIYRSLSLFGSLVTNPRFSHSHYLGEESLKLKMIKVYQLINDHLEHVCDAGAIISWSLTVDESMKFSPESCLSTTFSLNCYYQ